MRPSIGLAAFLSLAWVVTTGFMILSLACFKPPEWYDARRIYTLWAQFVMAVAETGVMLAMVVVCSSARRSLVREGRIQI